LVLLQGIYHNERSHERHTHVNYWYGALLWWTLLRCIWDLTKWISVTY